MATKYTFDAFDSAPVPSKKKHHRRHHSNTSEGDDPTDGNGSLTYSAASSVNSAAGESTDSSLAGIMRVLDVQDSKELAAVLEKERIRKTNKGSDRSVAAESQHSLAYSTDAESHMRSLATEQSGLAGTGILGTIAGQTSDQYEYDGGNFRNNPADPNESEDADNLIFAPAEHTDSLKRRKDMKRRERKQADNQTPRVKNSKKPTNAEESRAAQVTPPPTMNGHKNPSSSSSRPPKGRGGENMQMEEEEDVWFAKWWMFCFPDTVKTMTPKR